MIKIFKKIFSVLRIVFLKIKKLFFFLYKKTSYFIKNIKKKFWEKYKKSLSLRRAVAFILILAGIGIFNFLITKTTDIVPLSGGTYTEGLLDQPQFLNPLFAKSSSDFDINSLLFSSLLKEKNSQLEEDLAERWEVSEDKKTYTFYLKDNIFWHNGEKITTDDVIFTIEIAKNPNYEGILKNKFKDVEIKKIDERKIQFILKEPYYNFEKNLTFGILPKHLLGDLEFPKLLSSSFNLDPIGSGPYKFLKSEISEYGWIKSITLEANENWHFKKPFIRTIIFKFYPDSESLIEAYKKKEILGISFISPSLVNEAEKLPRIHLQKITIPRYIGIFFNLSKKEKFFSSVKVREALFSATDRDRILEEIFPELENKENFFLFDFLFKDKEEKGLQLSYNPKKAQQILKEAGFSDKNKDGILEKNGEPLSLEIISSDDPLIFSIAEKLEKMWKEVGADIEIQIFDIFSLSQLISKGAYDTLIYGINLDYSFDPYFWWHSTQCGLLNLSCFENEEIDKILRESQQIFDEKKRIKNYKTVFEALSKNLPVIPLVRLDFLYGINKSVKGVEIGKISFPYQRFSNIENWYMNFTRVLKKIE